MERTIKITYHWNLSDYPNLSDEMKERLEQEAEDRIYEMRKQWYTSGELNYEDEDYSIRGSWSFTYD